MPANWVFIDNLRPFLVSLGWSVGYTLDEDDWTAIRHGIETTDEESDRWFNYEFAGELSAHFSLAVDPGTLVIHVRVEVPTVAEPKVETALSIFQHFRLRTDT